MNNNALISIGTHDGGFHADDVLAVAILTTLFPQHRVIRTRDEDVLAMMDIVVDVGDMYDHLSRRYDHHMKDPPGDKYGHILSSAGLIWRHYGRSYLKTIGIPGEFVFNNLTFDLLGGVEKNILTHWIYPIDRCDNGVSQGPTTISEIVRSMRPTGPEKSRERFNTLFLETVSLVSHLFKRSCFHSADHVINKVKCNHDPKLFYSEDRIVVSRHPVHNYKTFGVTAAHFVICPCEDYDGAEPYFIIRPVQSPGTQEYKTPIPKDIRGTRRAYIENALKVTGINYAHHGGYLALADSEEDAVTFCKFLLDTQQQ